MTDILTGEHAADSRLERLRNAVDSGLLQRAQRMLHALPPAEIGQLLESMPPNEREIVWGLVDPEDRGEVLLHVADEVREGLISEMSIDELIRAAENLETDDLADLIETLPETLIQPVLRSMDLQDRQRLEAVLSYPPNSAGGLMNTDAVTVRPDVSIDVVLRYLRLRGNLPDHTDALFVADRAGRYLGIIHLDKLLTLEPELVIESVMDSEVQPIPVQATAAQVSRRFEDLDLISAPVVDENGAVVGRITVDDVLDVIRKEAEHSFLSMAGLADEEDLFSPILRSTRRRAVWLGINLFTAFVAARVVGIFEASIEQVVALAILMPVVASMGGTAGNQIITLMVRGLALGQIGRSNILPLLRKELAVSLLNGLLWALVIAIIVFVWFRSGLLALVIGLALVINLCNAALAGVGVPLLLKRLGVDPALASTVAVTTLTDVLGFLTFLGLGTLILL